MHIFLENLYYRICSSLNILNRQRDDSHRMEWHRLEIGDRQQNIQTNTYLNLIDNVFKFRCTTKCEHVLPLMGFECSKIN